jgi:hypothetical protein
MRKTQNLLLLAIAAVVTAAGADDMAARLGKATAVLNKMTQSGDIPAGELASADCVVVIPGFKKGALVVGVGHGRGFISCRNSGNWSAQARLRWIVAAWAYSSVAKKLTLSFCRWKKTCAPSCYPIVSLSGRTLRRLGEMARRHMAIATRRFVFTATPREPSRASISMVQA